MAFRVTRSAIIGNLATAIGLLASSRIDVVQIIDQQSMEQVFASARPMRAEVREYSRGMKYPIETGAILTDNIISEPTEIRMDLFIPAAAYATVYPQIRSARLNGIFFVIQTRTGTYKNMYIEEMPHDETADMFSAVVMHIKFLEAIQVGANAVGSTQVLDNFSPSAPADVFTINNGLISGLAAGSSILSYFHAASVVGL